VTFVREHKLKIISVIISGVAAILYGVSSNFLTEGLKGALTPTVTTPPPPPPPPPFEPCIKGKPVQATDSSIGLRFIAVDDSDALREIMLKPPSEYQRELRAAIQQERIKAVPDSASLGIHISGISTAKIPSQVPYLSGDNICQRMLPVARMDDGELRITAPVTHKGAYPGEGTILFPRFLVETSQRVLLCVEPSFSLSVLTEQRRNMLCSTGLRESALRGALSQLYVLIRTNSGKL
jgi:hypothetical protein